MKINIKNSFSKRDFLNLGGNSIFAFLFTSKLGIQANAAILDNDYFDWTTFLGPLLPPDENGIRLPAGFSSRIIAHSNQQVTASSNYIWHGAPDGGACFETLDGGWIYVSNSEIDNGKGGVGALRFNATGEVVDSYSILSGSNNNCAGGKTPWGTWLSCEEVKRGQVYECDPSGKTPAQLRPALGRFKHEAVAVDPDSSMLYLTEDEPNGCLYRFTPSKKLPDLSEGVLAVAEIKRDAGRDYIIWHPVPDPSALITDTRFQVKSVTTFSGGEGIACFNEMVYFTTKGDNKVWRYNTQTSEIEVVYDVANSSTPILSGVDNITITASGDLFVAEDGGDMQIVCLTGVSAVLPVLQIIGQDKSEICGPAFSPQFDRLYFSSQRGPLNQDDDGRIYEVLYKS